MSKTSLDQAIAKARPFMPRAEYFTVMRGLLSEEGEHFAAKLRDIASTIDTAPRIYDQDGKGDEAVAHLHYFHSVGDWWITELDIEPEQHQAFGLVDLGYGPELGYISIAQLVASGVELDLHWQPKTLAAIKQGARA